MRHKVFYGSFTTLLLPSALLAALATPFIPLVPGFRPVWAFFYAFAIAALALHWWALGFLVKAVLNGDRFLAAFRAITAAFPLALVFALAYAAIRIDERALGAVALALIACMGSLAIFAAIAGLAGLQKEADAGGTPS